MLHLSMMVRRRWQALRALYVLLACALLALPAGHSTSAASRIWTDAAAMVVVAPVAPPAVAVGRRASPATQERRERPDAPAAVAPREPEVRPANTTETLVLVPDRYLRNRALLC
jgi:hypothetical protein